jgi:hypothetical protein
MDSKPKSKKKATTNNNPANQSTIAFTASTSASSNSPGVKPPYGPDDKVVAIFQLAFGLLELAQSGDIRVHRGPLDAKRYLEHFHTFTQRGALGSIDKKNFTSLTKELVDSYTVQLRQRLVIVISELNLHLMHVALAPAVNCARGEVLRAQMNATLKFSVH